MNAVKAKGMEEPPADHLATIDWQRGEWAAIYPHNIFVATIASAHMLTWLHMVYRATVVQTPGQPIGERNVALLFIP